MRKNSIIVMLSGTMLLIFLLLAGCGDGQQEAPPAGGGGDIFILRLSNPDEALNALLLETDPAQWNKYQDKSTEITTSDRQVICYHIGVKSANALIAVFLNDYETAEKISTSIKDAANKLNIKSDEVETIAKQLASDLEEKDEKVKSRNVKQTLNMLQDAVVKALNSIGNKEEAMMIEFGAWIESIRLTSSIIMDDYSIVSASTLLRKLEAEYFMENFAFLNINSPSTEYVELIDAVSKLQALMQADANNSISQKAVSTINYIASQINQEIM